MHQLVNEQIPDDGGTLEEQAAVETDRAAGRATAPAGPLTTDQDALERKTQLAGALFECRGENLACTLHQPAPQQETHRMLIACIATECEQARLDGRYARPAIAAGEIHAPGFSTGRELDPRWWKRRIGDRLLPGLVAFALDPIAMALEKMLDRTGRGSGRHDDLYPPRVKDTHGQTAGTRTLSNDPSLGGILVRPQRQLWRHHVRHFPMHHGTIIAVAARLRRQKLNAVPLIR